ncbi:tetratricopeptide repeat protein [Mangrovimonas sp. CR14]|uniref:transglutaminase domain-containing protein n=1 Tax=Mangrovimonas sp. CR14 TaxID=2706120 RepID=UPI00141F61DD|nr:transglutaminase domain-containing protein [Mangrovimonas sp. CR14]NIK92068.1 tetratricopeptide repeat protein [Mangrovimonas sp. CR14]
MNKYFLLSITLFLSFLTSFSQSKFDKFWDLLLSNEREDAFVEFNSKKDLNQLEDLVINEILRVERGKLSHNEDFFESFLNKPNYDYYLYALWKEPFVFDDYFDKGFNSEIVDNVNNAFAKGSDNIDLRHALTYLKSLVERHKNNWDTYYQLNKSIEAIGEWQYCGVFENLNESGLDRVYEPELKPSSSELFNAESNGKVNWYNSFNTGEAYQFFTNHSEYGSGVHYAQTFFNAKESKRVILRVGNGSAFKIWLNDVLVLENRQDVTTELNAYQVELTIPEGDNRLLIKNAESSSVSYFQIQFIKDNQVVKFPFSQKVNSYQKSNLKELNVKPLENSFETYFINELKKNPNDIFLKYCLINTYLRNENYKKAKEIILHLYSEYPKSSFLRRILLKIYLLEKDNTTYTEIIENIELDDSDYYFPLILKLLDSDKMGRMSLNEMEDFLNKLKSTIDLKLIEVSADIYLNARNGDKIAMKKNLDKLVKIAEGNPKLTMTYAPFYKSVFKDEKTTLKILEDLNNEYFYTKAISSLSSYYEQQGNKKGALNVFLKNIDALEKDNYYLRYLIDKNQSYQNHEESLKFINKGLENYPYSFKFLEYKGESLLQLGKKEEAIIAFEESLRHNPNNQDLRKKIKDLKNEPNLLDGLVLEDAYTFISENKGKIKTNNYGYNILLDEGNIELYPEGGGVYRFLAAYEITSDSGIENFKEYNLGLSGNYILIKSEIVKSNGSIVPAERSGSNLVFNGLSIGDVVYVDYQNTFSSSGRFYKDYVDYFQFNSYHPTTYCGIKIIVPNAIPFNYKLINGEVPFKKETNKEYTLYKWELWNDDGLPQAENYMPYTIDLASNLHLSTIPDWNTISNWYSDLTRSRIEINSTVKDAFNEIFPDGFEQFQELERAEKIYEYITSNFTYSHVSFKQSGFVPQRPSKTILTKLGDCKDFSTLFVALGHMANLDSNLILVLTSDHGDNALILPSQDFNHCIVNLKINNKVRFIELTDKYLPFGSLPTSLYNANALEIPYDSNNSNAQYELFKLTNLERNKGVVENHLSLNLGNNSSSLKVETKISGHVASGYESIFVEPNHDVVKKSISELFEGSFEGDFTLDSLGSIETIDKNKMVKYTSWITLKSKPKTLGSMKIMQLPIVSNPYTSDLINENERNYPIEYSRYENVDEYKTTYDIYLDEGQNFQEIPENINLSFKSHVYKLTFVKISANHLKAYIYAKPSLEVVSTSDYLEFKEYVKKILEAEKQLIGYK